MRNKQLLAKVLVAAMTVTNAAVPVPAFAGTAVSSEEAVKQGGLVGTAGKGKCWEKDSQGHWYHLDEKGQFDTGWFQDTDGKWYYLQPDGIMKTGWYLDQDGKWYYLSQESKPGIPYGSLYAGGWFWIDGDRNGVAECYYLNADGSMLCSTESPDHYTVNEDGAWIVDGVVQTKQVWYSYTGISKDENDIRGENGGDEGGGNEGSGDEDGEEDKGSSQIYDGNTTAPVLIDDGYGNTVEEQRMYTQVKRAVGDLRQDISMVTGAIDDQEIQQLFVDDDQMQSERLKQADPERVPQLRTDIAGLDEDYAIIVGVLGESELVDGLVDAGKLEEAREIEGNWEAYVVKEVENPLPGVEEALVIAGSDARGTIYGVYSISEEIGVSPFYWYSDVPVEVKDEIDVDYSEAFVEDGPDVKYRGIFINDEEHAMDWAKEKFPNDSNVAHSGVPEVNYYRHVFEMMLRTGANVLWPAMHEGSLSFNVIEDENGIPVNSKEAAKYGVVIGNSHCEILLRTNTGEWAPWIKENKDKYGGNSDYDFSTNKEAVLAYWKERLETNKDFESILTIGMRGVHDGGFSHKNLDKYPGANDTEKKVNMMKDIIQCQRELITEVYGTDATNIPQVLIPYKEVNDLYNAGLNEMMMWDGSQDFNGDGTIDWRDRYDDVILMWAEDNHNYLRQIPNPEEAERSGGAGIYYHASYWGSPRSYLWTNEIQLSVMSEQMHRAYDTGAKDYWILNVGDIKPGERSMELFMDIAWDPEHCDDTTIQSEFLVETAMRDFQLDQDEAELVAAAMDEYYQLIGTSKPYYFNTGDPADRQFSVTGNGDEGMRFVERCNAVTDTLGAVYESLPEDVKTAFYQLVYYNALALRDAAEEHVYFQKNKLSAEQGRYGSAAVYADLSKAAGRRIDEGVEEFNSQNDNKWTHMMKLTHPGGNYERIKSSAYKMVTDYAEGVGAACENEEKAGQGMLRFSSQSPEDQRFFDVFGKNDHAENWVAEADNWITLSQNSGSVATEQRVFVGIDWDKVPVGGVNQGRISVYHVRDGQKAEKPSAVFQVEAVQSAGTYELTLNRLPTLNEGKTLEGAERTLNVGVGVGDSTPQVLVGTRKTSGQWGNNVIRQYEPLSCRITVKQGWNDLVIYRSDADFVFDRMIIETAEGAVSEGRLGPWESPNNIVEDYVPARAASLPEELGDHLLLPNVMLHDGETTEIEIEGMIDFELPDEDLLTIVQNDTKLEITAKRAGMAQFTVNTEAGAGTQNVIVWPRTDAGLGVYQENNGQVVMNAADAMNDTRYTYRIPAKDGVHTWELDGTGLKVLPDISGTKGKWDSDKGAPAVSYTVEIHDPGTYYLFLNMSNPDADSDSYHVTVDGTFRYTDKDGTYDGEKLWHSKGSGLKLDTGRHTITVSAREDGFSLNQLLLTKDKNAKPEGFLEASDTAVPAPEIVMDDLKNIIMQVGETKTIDPKAVADNGAAVTLQPLSSDGDVVEATAEDGKIVLEALGEGRSEVSVTALADGCEEKTVDFQVMVTAETADKGVYLEQDGRIVINAADALEQSVYAMAEDASDDIHLWETCDNGAGLQVLPDDGTNWTKETWNDLKGTAPALTYQVKIESDDSYYLYVNVTTPKNNGASDSYHVALDGTYQYKDNPGSANDGEEIWRSKGTALELTKGVHTLTLFAREDGLAVNQIILTREKQEFEGLQTPSGREENQEIPEDPEASYLPDENGNVIIDAADAFGNTAYASCVNEDNSGKYPDVAFSWKQVLEDGQDRAALQLTPVADPSNKMEWLDKELDQSPSITYRIWVPEAGEYYLSVYSNAPNANSDSFHFGVNGKHVFVSKEAVTNENGSGGTTVGEGWFYYDKTPVQLEKGENTITIAARESGNLIRQIMLSREKQENLSGWLETSEVGTRKENDFVATSSNAEEIPEATSSNAQEAEKSKSAPDADDLQQNEEPLELEEIMLLDNFLKEEDALKEEIGKDNDAVKPKTADDESQ